VVQTIAVMGLIVALLILAGLGLIIIEVVFIPGTTVIGLVGAIMAIAGIIFGYSAFGNTVGFYIMLSTLAALALLLYFSFRSGAWKKFANKSAINSKFNEGLNESFSVGQEGVCVSALRPMGKAEFNHRTIEVSSLGNYLDAGTPVRIKEVTPSGIIVEQIA
jgi:membrane-bound ClpP family serine protease